MKPVPAPRLWLPAPSQVCLSGCLRPLPYFLVIPQYFLSFLKSYVEKVDGGRNLEVRLVLFCLWSMWPTADSTEVASIHVLEAWCPLPPIYISVKVPGRFPHGESTDFGVEVASVWLQ